MDAPNTIELREEGRFVAMAWDDGTAGTVSATVLRRACPCADCRSAVERGSVRLTAAATIVGARLVGSYGINFTFAPDGHHTGIFTFDQLKDLVDSGDTST